MNQKTKKVFFLVSAISLALILIILAGWFFYTHKNKQSPPVPGYTIDLNSDDSYPKVESYTVPILMYHYIRDAPADDKLGLALSVTPQNFAAQMAWLNDHDFETIKLSDLADTERIEISKVIGEGGKPIIITFDDGYTDAYDQAFPILKQNNFVADFFIITNYVAENEYMDWSQISALKKAGMEIGSHTLTHPDLTDLETADARHQIADSKDDTVVFCYPAGRYNDQVRDLVKEAGYVAAVTTKSGVATQDSKLFDLPRIRIKDMSGSAFGSIIENVLGNE